MKLYENKGKKYLEDNGVLNEVVDSTNIYNYVEEYQDKLNKKEQITLELSKLNNLLEKKKENLADRKIIELYYLPICIILFSLFGLIFKTNTYFIAVFAYSLIVEILTYIVCGTREENKEKIANLEEEIEQKETELLNKEQELTKQKQLIESCLENKSYVEDIDYTKETKDKPLTRTLEKDKF